MTISKDLFLAIPSMDFCNRDHIARIDPTYFLRWSSRRPTFQPSHLRL
ncbi:MAG: hypothetical protein KDJ43_01540 [Rhizobiaceae bacterium]|nr:hypothetical protein [Rhizobiaceae bacterium]